MPVSPARSIPPAALGVAAAIAMLTLATLAPAPAVAAPLLSLIGEATFANDYRYAGTLVGGLSGIDHDAADDRYLVISDDRAVNGPPRFYRVAIDLGDGRLDNGDVTFTDVVAFQNPTGTLIDPEAIRLGPGGGSLYWADEGNNNAAGQAPTLVREMTPAGVQVRTLTNDATGPDKFAPRADNLTGMRHNLAFESLSLSADGTRLYTATEAALNQDGAPATLTAGSPARVLALDVASGLPVAEYVYPVDPVVDAPNPAGGFVVAGLVDLLAWSDTSLLALERSFSVGAPGTGHTARLYLADLAGATDVLGLESLAGGGYTAIDKQLVLDLADLGIVLDNLEGMTFGPTLPSGNRSLILVSDNNFAAPGAAQFTQFLAFEVIETVPLPAPLALLAPGLLLLGRRARARCVSVAHRT